MLELPLVTQGDLSPKPCSVEESFPSLQGLWLFAPRETKVMSGGAHHTFLSVLANKQTHLFVLLRVKMLILLCYKS